MQNTLKKTIKIISHPLVALIVMVVCILFSRDMQLLPETVFGNVAKDLTITLVAIPAIVFLSSRLIKKHISPENGNLFELAALATYFTLLAFMGGTHFRPISMLQQLPLAILIAAMIMENRKLLLMPHLCLTALAVSLFFASIIFKTSYIAPLIATILIDGAVTFFDLEESNGNTKALFFNTLLGLSIPILYFFITIR